MPTHLLSRRSFFQLASLVGVMAASPKAFALAEGSDVAPASGAAPAAAAPPPAPAPPAAPGSMTSRIVRTTSDERGVTLFLELAQAPFPAAGSWHRDPTVIVFVPAHHRSAARGAGRGGGRGGSASRESDDTISFVVHFHGHNTTAERAMVAHQLREQLFDSKQNAILVVPELAVMAPDSAAGKLEAPGAFGRLLADVLRTLDTRDGRAALGPTAPAPGARPGRVCVSAHSGGYHAAACAIRAGGAPVQEVWLFDALYADVDVFRDWVIAGRGLPMGTRHKLISYFTAGTTEANTRRLFAELDRAGVACESELVEGTLSRAQLTQAEAVSIRTQLTHGTVTSELNSLRDCLYASALRRRLRTSWFDTKQGSRPLERRR